MYPTLNLFHGIEKILIITNRECGFAIKKLFSEWYFKIIYFYLLVLSYYIEISNELPLSFTKPYPLSLDMHYMGPIIIKKQISQCFYIMIWDKVNKDIQARITYLRIN